MKPTAAPGILQRLAGFVLLVVFGAVQMRLAPLLVAAIAYVDGGHEVELASDCEGERLVLHHSAKSSVGHRHHGLMILLAGRDDGRFHSDHRFFFACAGLLEKEKDNRVFAEAAATDTSEVSETVDAQTTGSQTEWRPNLEFQRRQWWPPSPASGAWGCVVLLI
jgi:hypothetical protein